MKHILQVFLSFHDYKGRTIRCNWEKTEIPKLSSAKMLAFPTAPVNPK